MALFAHDPFLSTESRLRLQTSIRLRWFAVVGQLIAVVLVSVGLGFALPLGWCVALIALSAWLNVFLRIWFPARHRLSTGMAMTLLAYDTVQLTGLLFLTGGIENPFIGLIVAPVMVSAATLPPASTIGLGALAASAVALLVQFHLPLPWYAGEAFALPTLYMLGILAAVLSGMVFQALYVWRLAKEARQMSAALSATEQILAREQRLHALDGLAAAAAHELGTPLGTITLIAKELNRTVGPDSPIAEDLALLQSQANRCRDILQKLTRSPSERDPLHARLSVTQIIEEASEPYRARRVRVSIDVGAEPGAGDTGSAEPVGERRPGLIYGVGNLVENAVEFARGEVAIVARWSSDTVTITLTDDGPGFPSELIDTLGEPYVTTRPRSANGRDPSLPSGLGLGFFIAKTLLERSGATLTLENRLWPASGAIVRIQWRRAAFEQSEGGFSVFDPPAERKRPTRVDA
jgi:two-component system sensor histidine kinase RegB